MGAIISSISNLESRCKRLESKIAFLERDVINHGVQTTKNTHKIDSVYNHVNDNTSKLLNISLLEEGRSVYRPKNRASHTASSYR